MTTSRNNRSQAFTVLELLIVSALVFSSSLFAISISIPQIQGNQTEAQIRDIESLLFLCQQNAYSGKNDSGWGIRFYSTEYHFFNGDSYDTASSIEEVQLSGSMDVSLISLSDSGRDITFSAGDLAPQAYGTVRLSDHNNSYILTINKEGLIHTYAQ